MAGNTITFVVNLKKEGQEHLGYTLLQKEPKIYVSEESEVILKDKILVDSGIRVTVKRGDENPLKNYFNPGDRIKIITIHYKCIGEIISFPTISAGTNKNYVGVKLKVDKDGCFYRYDEFSHFTTPLIISNEEKIRTIYSGILLIEKLYD
jgi:hypothetical protein